MATKVQIMTFEIVGLSAYFYNNIRCSEFNLKEGEITKTFEKSNILTKGSVNIESQKIYKKGKVYSKTMEKSQKSDFFPQNYRLYSAAS